MKPLLCIPHIPSFPRFAASVLAVMAAGMVSSQATLLVYEGFNYGLSNNTTMSGVTTSATGLTGNYGLSNTGAASSVYQTSGLSLSGFSSSGGSVRQSAPSGNASILGAQLNAGPQTGTLWHTHLFEFSALGNNNAGVAAVRLNTSATTGGGTSWLGSYSDVGSAIATPGIAYDSMTSSGGSPAIALDTTYLFVSRFTNVGTALSVGTPGSATAWVMTQANYDAWVAGGSLESGLASNSTWTMTDNVTSGTFNFNNSAFLQFGTAGGGVSQTLRMDEVRWGTTLASVTPVPEPSTFALVGFVVGVAFLRRKRLKQAA